MAVVRKNKYRNKKTGTVIETTHKISGPDWELVKKNAAKPDDEKESSKEDE